MDGPGLEDRGVINFEGPAGIQQRCRYPEHMEEDAQTEQHKESSASPSHEPASRAKATLIAHPTHPPLVSITHASPHDQHGTPRMLHNPGGYAAQEEPSNGAQAFGA